jgi:hypothetical protein
MVIVLSVLVLGLTDYMTGYELSFFVFYFIPIAITAWWVDPISSYLIAILSSIVWFLCDHYSSRPYSSAISPYWNVTTPLLSFLIIAYTTSKIRFLLSKERKTSQERFRQIKTLDGLVPICADCKKIRNDRGYWQRVEEYLSEHTDATFTHGLCEECVSKLLKEAGIDNWSQLLPGMIGPNGLSLTFTGPAGRCRRSVCFGLFSHVSGNRHSSLETILTHFGLRSRFGSRMASGWT